MPVNVRISSDLSATGKTNFRIKQIDSCIAPIVEALQKNGIDMRGSCCGHGKAFGHILLEDGRVLVIFPTTKEVYELNDKLRNKGE